MYVHAQVHAGPLLVSNNKRKCFVIVNWVLGSEFCPSGMNMGLGKTAGQTFCCIR